MASNKTGTFLRASGLTLYGTTACHLCELAEQILQYHHENIAQLSYAKKDISESDELFLRYGVRIPVLRRADGEELGWPFNAMQLGSFLESA